MSTIILLTLSKWNFLLVGLLVVHVIVKTISAVLMMEQCMFRAREDHNVPAFKKSTPSSGQSYVTPLLALLTNTVKYNPYCDKLQFVFLTKLCFVPPSNTILSLYSGGFINAC